MWLLGEFSNQRLRETFDKIDTNGDGKLDSGEISAALASLGKRKEAVRAAVTAWEMQTDDGMMSFDEVLRALA